MTGLYAAVRAVAERQPAAPAVRTTAGDSTDYAGLVRRADRLAGGLTAAGLRPGQALAFDLRPGIGYVALILATARLGARYVPLMSNFGPDDVRTALELTKPALVVTDRQQPESLHGVRTTALGALAAASELPPADEDFSDAVFRTLWTSGSTGFPKLMAWKQGKFVTERHRWNRDTGITAADVFFCRHTLDVAHATDLHVFAALLAGAGLVLADPAAPAAELLRQIAESGATAMSALPQHYDDYAEAGRSGAPDLSRMRRALCGGAYLSPATVRRADEILGLRVRGIYGSTEFGLALGDMADAVRDDTAMVPVAGVGTRLEPLAGTGGADTGIGELVLISPCTSEGYLNDAAATARTFRGTEFWTGDLARRTPDGAYLILGRATEALATTDGPLAAPQLDERLAATGAVRDAVCLPEHPGAYRDSVLVALRPAEGRTADEACETVEKVLGALGLTARVRVVDRIPRTPVGKVDKPLLRLGWHPRERGRNRPVPPVHDTGAGPAILLVPGLAATAAFLAGAAADLARDHRVVTVELPGHGDAPAGPRPATVDSAAELVAAAVDGLGLRDVTLVGWSLGATVTYAYLEQFGTDRIGRLVSVEQTPRLITGKDWTHAAFGGLDAPGAKALLAGAADDPESFARTLVGSSFAAGTDPDPALLDRLTTEALRCEPSAVRELLADVAVQDWRAWLSALTLPTLLVHGARSQVYPTGVGQWLADTVPGARLETFPDSGHLPFLEEPARFTAAVRAFAAAHPAAPAAAPEPERQP